MKLGRCPICHNQLHLEAILEDDAARELLMLLTTKATYGTARHLVAYIGLFRPEKSNLSNSRAVKIVNEVLTQFVPSRHLSHALVETVKQIRERRAQGQYNALTNHNYLAKVYESTKELFLYTNTNSDREPSVSNELNDRQLQNEYFMQMQRLGQNIAALPGGEAWLQQQKVK